MSDDLLKRSEEAVKYLRGVAEGFSGSITEKKLTTAASLIAELTAKLREREAAIKKTLDDNAHLADGDNCTLIDLKRVIATPPQKEQG